MPLATIPCFDGGTPVVSVASTDQVTAGQVGASERTSCCATHLPNDELAGTASRSFWLSPGTSMTQTRWAIKLVLPSPLRPRAVIANLAPAVTTVAYCCSS